MSHFFHDDHMFQRLENLKIAIVAGTQTRHAEVGTALAQRAVLRTIGGMVTQIGLSSICSIGRGRCQRRDSPVRRVDHQ